MLTGYEFFNNQFVKENAIDSKVGGQAAHCVQNNHSSSITSDEFLSIYRKFYQEAVQQEKKQKTGRVSRSESKQTTR